MTAKPTLPVSFDDVRAAAQRIQGIVHRTPTLTSRTANARYGAEFFFKCENYQRMGAFKFRGAANAIARLTPEERVRGVVAFSSGNHAQAVALAAREAGIKATILMPKDAPQMKIAATRGYGATVQLFDRYQEDREVLAQRIRARDGLTLIPPYNHADVIAGSGTAALELMEDVGNRLDAVFVCMGGGGLSSGTLLTVKALAEHCAVYPVEPEAGNDGQQSFRTGKLVRIETPKTLADGAQTQSLGTLTFPIVQALATDVLTVTDNQLIDTMKFYAERMKMVVEPTGCLSGAAAFSGDIDVRGQRVGVIISGGNIDLTTFARLMADPA